MCERNFLQRAFDASQFIGQHGLKQIKLPRKISVQRFLADPQFLRQVVHGHTAESVTEKVSPGSTDDPLSVEVVLAALRPGFANPFHVCVTFITTWKLIQYI